MSEQNVRWEQRFSNYNKALEKLDQAVNTITTEYTDENGVLNTDDFLDDMLKEGLIQRFEYTHELAWKVMKDYANYQGFTDIGGSRDATRNAFSTGLITDGEVWMEMIRSRNLTTHTYNEETADEIFTKIMNDYHPQFLAFREKMEEKRGGSQEDLLDSV
ncbi:nucleotidyltransferase substrate binding protein [Tunicatimonas pelagia]|uniref:nucleotidyltransferase substrate binding protein n=1 Tax=Tunicatimonas pelagia TaxID=931531 RepID=UPI00266577D4|nr:nucleotidyltransferase substrate binding protein [Tunicatimonas pelagia]WKN43956.1 nucleotidyltransferase substrate binding protein [Tunicatimonas pelagia]